MCSNNHNKHYHIDNNIHKVKCENIIYTLKALRTLEKKTDIFLPAFDDDQDPIDKF